jgi:acyl carrier protein
MNLNAQQLIDFLSESRKLSAVTESTALFSDGTIDSVGMIDLIAFIEEQAGIEVGQADVTLENFDSIERILTYVRGKQGA